MVEMKVNGEGYFGGEPEERRGGCEHARRPRNGKKGEKACSAEGRDGYMHQQLRMGGKGWKEKEQGSGS